MSSTARTRPDACPGVLSPHDAADGALARVRLPGGVITAGQLRAVADVALRCGDGVVHLTSRGNLQLRGLDRTDPAVVRGLSAAGLLPSATHERVRNVLASPASGIDGGLADVRGLAAALDREICSRPELAALPGRFLFALDDGRGDVAAQEPDVCWAATGPDLGELLVADERTGSTCDPADAPELLADAAAAFLAVRREAAPDTASRPSAEAPDTAAWCAAEVPDAAAWRAAEVPDAAARVVRRLRRSGRDAGTARDRGTAGSVTSTDVPGTGSAPARRSRGSAEPPPAAADRRTRADRVGSAAAEREPTGGPFAPVGHVGPVGTGGAVGVAPVLGELTADAVVLLADLAPVAIVTPWRTVLLPAPTGPATASDRLRAAGLVVDPWHPAVRISACAGRPGCARSLADVRAHARGLVTGAAPVPTVHLSGCARRCGAPRAAHVDAVATADREYIVDGAVVPADELGRELPAPPRDPSERNR